MRTSFFDMVESSGGFILTISYPLNALYKQNYSYILSYCSFKEVCCQQLADFNFLFIFC